METDPGQMPDEDEDDEDDRESAEGDTGAALYPLSVHLALG